MRRLGLLVGLLALVLPSTALSAATIIINNRDKNREGFNDTTAATPVGGNTGTTIGQQRLIAFQTAVDIWAAVLQSSVTITIDANFDPLTCDATGAVLGQAGTNTIHRDFLNAPRPGTWFPQALANSLAGSDLSTQYSDLHAQFNSDLGTDKCPDFQWYYGLDGNAGTGIDLVAVLLHEFAHGFGFMTLVGTSGAWYSGYPDIYAHFLHDNDTVEDWDSMTDAERAASYINPRAVVWTGALVHAQAPAVLEIGAPALQVTSPAGIAGMYDAGEAEFGVALTTTGAAGSVVQGFDGTADPTLGCAALTSGPHTGQIVFLDRGTCNFSVKVKNAQDAGARGVIIADHTAGEPPGGLPGTDATVTIPSVRVSLATGNLIRAALSGGVTASLLLDPSRRAGTDSNDRPLVWTPDPYESGSSVSHWDVIARPNLLMEPYSNDDEQHAPDLALPLMRDIGWLCATPAPDAVAFTARFTDGTAKLEWQNAASGTSSPPVIRYRTDATFPAGPPDGTGVTCAAFDGGAGAYNSCTVTGLANGGTYRYRHFSANSECYSPGGPKLAGSPFATAGRAKWAYATGASSLTPPGVRPGVVGTGAIYAASNDNHLHAMNPSAEGGDWPRSASYAWLPFVMNQPAPHRPVVLPLNAGPRVVLASQDGYVYSVNAETGALVAETSAPLGETLQASPVGFFSDFVPGAPDLLFVGTRNTAAANELVALSPANLDEIPAMTFTGDGAAMGIINGAMVSYGDWRVYFTTRARSGGSSDTVWCVDVSGSSVTKVWSQPLGDIDGAPVVHQGRVYVGTNTGWVYVLNAADGVTLWSWDTGTGQPIKGSVVPHYGTSPIRMYLATSSTVWAVDFGVSTAAWSYTATAPSVPLLRYDTGLLYFGDGTGVLHQIDTTSGNQTGTVLLGTSALGAPAFDNVNSMIYVGSTAGIVYGVSVPL